MTFTSTPKSPRRVSIRRHFNGCRRLDEDRLHGFGTLLLNGGFTLLSNLFTNPAILPAFYSTATTAPGQLHHPATTPKQNDPGQSTKDAPAQQEKAADDERGAGKTEGMTHQRG